MTIMTPIERIAIPAPPAVIAQREANDTSFHDRTRDRGWARRHAQPLGQGSWPVRTLGPFAAIALPYPGAAIARPHPGPAHGDTACSR